MQEIVRTARDPVLLAKPAWVYDNLETGGAAKPQDEMYSNGFRQQRLDRLSVVEEIHKFSMLHVRLKSLDQLYPDRMEIVHSWKGSSVLCKIIRAINIDQYPNLAMARRYPHWFLSAIVLPILLFLIQLVIRNWLGG
jgi:hypothetical protein